MKPKIASFFGPCSHEVLLNLEHQRLAQEKLEAYGKHQAALVEEHRHESGEHADGLAERAKQVEKQRHRLKELDDLWNNTVDERWHVEHEINNCATWLKLKKMFGNGDLDALLARVKVFDDKLLSLEQRLPSARETLKQIDEEHTEIAAPINSLAYGIEQIRLEIEKTNIWRQDLSDALNASIVAVIGTVPLNMLCCRLTSLISGEQMKDILELRERLGERHVLRVFPSARAMGLDEEAEPRLEQRIHSGYVMKANQGTGSINVRGHGQKRVSRTRIVNDGNGNIRTESYTANVKIHFEGIVNANYQINYRHWQPEPLARELAENGKTMLGKGRDRDRREGTELPRAITHIRQSLGLPNPV